MRERILVVGAGFAGMWSALSASRALHLANRSDGTVEILLVAPAPELHVRPRFYEAPVDAMKSPLLPLLEAANVKFHQGLVETIRTTAQEIDAIDAEGNLSTISYDKLILAAGSRLFRPALPGLHEHGLSVDLFDEAVQLDEHLHKLSELPPTSARNTVVVVGGGFSGIETAAEIGARMRTILGIDTDVRVIILEREHVIGPDLGPGPRPVIERALRAVGVSCRLGAAVESIDVGG
uniref:FAD-dependent oxidoreductase n=1 Tax=Hydrogenophaga sp. TaxID=1904254 RepID=UPI003561F2EF